jgi:hypothetical protein
MKVTRPWWSGERIIPVSQIPYHVPPRYAPDEDIDPPVSRATAYRWTTAGIDGVRIRRFKSGGGYYTTVEELRRWQRDLTLRSEGQL